MCLPIAVDRPNDVLATGTHSGHEWVVVHNGSGFRCGYVKLNSGHPWYGRDSFDYPVNVHGGITFYAPDKACDKCGPDNGWWIGFDCAHYLDRPDPTLPVSGGSMMINYEGEIRTQEYVESECRSLCEQASVAV